MKCPPLTDEMFPPPLDLLRAACDRTEVHPAAAGIQFLVAVGNLLGRGAFTYVAESRHGTNEFALVVGPTAVGRKGDAANLAQAALADVDPGWFANMAGGLSSGEGLIHAVRDAITTMKNGEEVITDPGVADKRFLCLETEFSAVLKQFRRDSNILSNVVRQAWDGKPVLRTLTKTSPTRATEAHISVLGHATAEDLRAHLMDLDVANGVANRFLFVASERPRVDPSPRRLTTDVRERITRHVRAVLEHGRTLGPCARTPAAERVWCDLYPEVSRHRPGLLGALLARGPAHLVRLGLIFSMLARARAVDEQHLTAAAAWLDYCSASTAIIFANRTGNDAADRIRAEMLVGDELTLSQIREQLFAKKIASARLADALDLLRALGEVEVEQRESGGRPATIVRRTAPAAEEGAAA
jgi:hypothetical protein